MALQVRAAAGVPPGGDSEPSARGAGADARWGGAGRGGRGAAGSGGGVHTGGPRGEACHERGARAARGMRRPPHGIRTRAPAKEGEYGNVQANRQQTEG
eukprot:1183230-Prorocentrum_minimum.AAC.3